MAKVKRLSIPTNQIAKNREFGLPTLRNLGQSPKAVPLPNAYMAMFFLTKVTESRRKFGSAWNGNPNEGREAIEFFH